MRFLFNIHLYRYRLYIGPPSCVWSYPHGHSAIPSKKEEYVNMGLDRSDRAISAPCIPIFYSYLEDRRYPLDKVVITASYIRAQNRMPVLSKTVCKSLLKLFKEQFYISNTLHFPSHTEAKQIPYIWSKCKTTRFQVNAH